jgi:uncharacterized membrane protein
MSSLIVITFPNIEDAEKALHALKSLQSKAWAALTTLQSWSRMPRARYT